jgi:hypothetical protein
MAYELTDLQNNNFSVCIYENKDLWKYKPEVFFDTMVKDLDKLDREESDFSVLRYFVIFKNDLENVIYLPYLIKMVKKLKNYLTKNIMKDYAMQATLQECLESNLFDLKIQQNLLNEFRQYVENLQFLWVKCKIQLEKFLKNKMLLTRLKINDEHVFSMNTKLSFFLPSKYGDGFACYALIQYLSTVHNDFIKKYLSFFNRNESYLDINQFDNQDFIIQFGSKTNLLRLITSNYEFDSKNSKLIFDYHKIQRKLVENFIQSKPLIQLDTIEKSILFEYSNEMNDIDEILIRLSTEIKQELVDEGTQKAIYDEFKQINEMSEALHVLKAMINFACTTSFNPEVCFSEFVHQVYPQNTSIETILKARITETCKLKHLKHVWLIIMMKRAVLFTLNGQEPFEMLQSDFRHETNVIFTLAPNSLTLVSIGVVFYQFIIRFIRQIKQEDVNFYKQYSMSDAFYAISDNESGRSDIEFPSNTPPEDLAQLFPDDLQLQNTYSVWKYIVQNLSKNH